MILATFSLDWFMTIPGMLITGGVLFLIIALIIFIVTGNKKPKTNKEVVKAQEASQQEAVSAVTPATNQDTIPTNEQVVTSQPIVTSDSVTTSPVSSMAEKVGPQEVEPAVFTATLPQDIVTPQPIVNNQAPNVLEQSTPVNSTVVSSTIPIQNQVDPTLVVPTIETPPVVNQPVVPEVPVQEKKEVVQTPTVDMPRPIYGGVSPIVPNVSHEEHRPIYGGANPLENTQSVPIVPQRPIVTETPNIEIPTVEAPTVPVTPSVTPQASNDIFANSSVAATPVNSNPVVEPTAVQPTQPTVSQSQPEEIESLF